MKSLLSAAVLLVLAAAFGLAEPAPASTPPVTSTDVEIVSEQIVEGVLEDTISKAARGQTRGRGYRGRSYRG
jgi:hypothetical protein